MILKRDITNSVQGTVMEQIIDVLRRHNIKIVSESSCGLLICADNADILPLIPDGAVDAVITDPPYGVRKTENWDEKDNFVANINTWIRRCRIVSPRVIWFCAGRMLGYILENNADNLFRVLIWNKPAGSQYNGASHNNLWYSNELMLLFGEREDWAVKGKDSQMSGSVFDAFPVPQNTFGHPTTKPIELMRWLIAHHTNPNDLILDPYCGSGSTLVAAKQLGRRYIGIEISPKYCKIAEDRLAQEQLFPPTPPETPKKQAETQSNFDY